MRDSDFERMVEILVVEDNPGDAQIIREAFSESKTRHRLTVTENGDKAMAFLHQSGEYQNAHRPDLVLLDLNMPRKDGRAVLAEMKSDPQLRRIPVIVLTSSQAEVDIARAYHLNVNSYITKPTDPDEFIRVLKSIEDFWLTVVRLPKE